MTFLQLCKDVALECGVGSGTVPTAVTNQVGQLARVVKWTKDAYTDIQNAKPNWRWLRSEFSVATVASDDEYAYTDCTDTIDSVTISRFARWGENEFQVYLTSAGVATRHPIGFLRWEAFRQAWLTGAVNNGYPVNASIDPRNRLRLGPKPDAIYTFTGEYQKSAQILAADADEPEMPARFHQLIVKEAMKRYAGFYAAPEVWQRADNEARPLWAELRLDQLPSSGFGGPLA